MPFPLLAEFGPKSAEDTACLAKSLAPHFRAGDVVLLSGPIGAGKTHFARSVIQSRLASVGRYEEVPSPSYTLVQTFDLPDIGIWHADLYRLSGPDELIELGLEDAFDAGLSLVEWPENRDDWPKGALWIKIELAPEEDSRVIRLSGDPSVWGDRIAAATPDHVNLLPE